MQHGQVHEGMRVAVATLTAIPRNYASFNDAPSTLVHAPHVFKSEWFDNRTGRIGHLGTVRRSCAGHATIVFVVEHDDGTNAVYHHLELVRPEDLPAALSADDHDSGADAAGEQANDGHQASDFERTAIDGPTMLFSGTVGDTLVEAFTGLAPTEVEADVLIAPFVSDRSPADQLEERIHGAIQQSAGDWFHSRLAALGDSFGPYDAKHIEGPTDQNAVPFKSVVFLNGVEPKAEAMAAALQAAHDAQGKSVILSVESFNPGFTGALNVGTVLRGIISVICTLAEKRGTKFDTVKVVF